MKVSCWWCATNLGALPPVELIKSGDPPVWHDRGMFGVCSPCHKKITADTELSVEKQDESSVCVVRSGQG